MARLMKDEYEILSGIGEGGMATVYKAVQKSLDRPVAIKELKKSYHGDPQIVKRFERESRVAASLQHENIVHIYDYWKRPHYAIVMEYVDGATLADVIGKTGALPVDVGVMIAIQVTHALEYAHMRGLVHRDIKPGNIMIRRNGEVKLMDFGIAQARNLEALTVPGMLLGTPAYMSPEQIMGQQLDVRSDIFSFGIVLYEMLTGIKPFVDDDTRAVTARIMKDRFPAPRGVNSDIPWRLHWLIKKCLRKKPHRRHASMLAVEKKLGRHLAGRTTKAASLHRIADYLVSRKVFDAAPEQETVIAPAKPAVADNLRASYAAAAIALLLTTGVAISYFMNRDVLHRLPLPLSELPRQNMTAPLVSEQRATVDSKQTATKGKQEETYSPTSSVREKAPASEATLSTGSTVTVLPSAMTVTPPAEKDEARAKAAQPASDAATAITRTVHSRPATTVDKKAVDTGSAKKKSGTAKKKKKKAAQSGQGMTPEQLPSGNK